MSFKRTLSIVGLSSSLVGFASAEVESSISAGYNNQYIYRGVDFGDDQATLSIKASGAGWDAGILSSTSNVLDAGSLDETRIRAGLTTGMSDCLTVSAGVISTSYNLSVAVEGLNLAADRLEVYVGAETNLAGIDLGAMVFFNQTDAFTGDTYYELSANYTSELSETVELGLGVTYGNWNKDFIGGSVEDLDFVSISAKLKMDLGENVTGTVGINHVITDTDLTQDETVVGTSLTLGF